MRWQLQGSPLTRSGEKLGRGKMRAPNQICCLQVGTWPCCVWLLKQKLRPGPTAPHKQLLVQRLLLAQRLFNLPQKGHTKPSFCEPGPGKSILCLSMTPERVESFPGHPLLGLGTAGGGRSLCQGHAALWGCRGQGLGALQ